MGQTASASRTGGYSFLELLVAMGLVGVVSFTALPVASQYLAQYQLSSAANQLAFQIVRARTQAIGQNVYARVRFINSNQYIRETSTGGTNYSQDGTTTTLPTGITTAAGVTAGMPSFNKNGLATGSAATITLTSSAGRKSVQTNILGRVTVS